MHVTRPREIRANFAESLRQIAGQSQDLQQALTAARELGLTSWCIGAGAVRNVVWDHLHGYPLGASFCEVDLVYFDVLEPIGRAREIQDELRDRCPRFDWDVTNQAHVHQWYAEAHGRDVPPLGSLVDGVASWPEYATCVGVSLSANGALTVVAPHGLDDLFALVLRHNPARASRAIFESRCATKGWLERWPRLRMVA